MKQRLSFFSVVAVFHQLLLESHLCGPAFAFTVMNGIDETSVVPVLDHVVWTVMNLHFNGVATVVNQEYDCFLAVAQHGGYVLSRHLETPISDESQHWSPTALLRNSNVGEKGTGSRMKVG